MICIPVNEIKLVDDKLEVWDGGQKIAETTEDDSLGFSIRGSVYTEVFIEGDSGSIVKYTSE